MNPQFDSSQFLSLSQLTLLEQDKHQFTFKSDLELIRISFLKAELFKIEISRGGSFVRKASSAVIHEDSYTHVLVREDKKHFYLKTNELWVSLNKKNCQINARRHDGHILIESHESLPYYSFLNDSFIINRKTPSTALIAGLGQKSGSFNRMGQSYSLWNTDILSPDLKRQASNPNEAEPRKDPTSDSFDPYYISIPFWHQVHPQSSLSTGYFLDNPARAFFNFQNTKDQGLTQIRYNSGQYSEYFFAKTTIAESLKDYLDLTGHTPMPAEWTLGYHQCRWKKYSPKELHALADEFIERDIPCSSLWLDIDYMNEYRVFTWNKKLFPKPKGLIQDLKDKGFKTACIVDPGIKHEQGYSVFDQAHEKELLCKTKTGQTYIGQVWPGKTAFPDFSKTATRQWWGEKNLDLIKLGIAGIWNDMNEPATGDIPCEDMLFDNDGAPTCHDRFHNEYALLMAQATHDKWQEILPDETPFILSRAGSAGIQRYAANWLGDSCSSWEHMRMSIPMSTGLSISGQAFIGADIGGFFGPTTPELFIRWLQMAVFTPFFRNHNDDNQDQYPWSFGPYIESIARRFIKIRYQLMPYIKEQFKLCSEKGIPIQRPLIYDYQDDKITQTIEDQFLFGSSLLVAPVLEAKATSRSVYLPKGQWRDIFTDKTYEGPRMLSLPVSFENIPVFQKTNQSIYILDHGINNTKEKKLLLSSIQLHE